jgi:hypothetical protein
MNRDPITIGLAAALLMSVSATAGLCYWYLQCTRENQNAQSHLAGINNKRAIMQSLAAECADYAKKDPRILQILQELGWRPRGETNAHAPN